MTYANYNGNFPINVTAYRSYLEIVMGPNSTRPPIPPEFATGAPLSPISSYPSPSLTNDPSPSAEIVAPTDGSTPNSSPRLFALSSLSFLSFLLGIAFK